MITDKNLQEFMQMFSEELRRQRYPISNINCITAKCHEIETYALSLGIETYDIDLGLKFLSTWYPITGNIKTNADIDIPTKNAYWAVGLLNDFLLHGVFTTMRRKRLIPLSDEQEKLLFEFHDFQLNKGFADNSSRRNCYYMRVFLLYLQANKIEIMNIDEKCIVGFLATYIDKSKCYISAQICSLKRFSIFLFETGKTKQDTSKLIPTLSKSSGFRIPSVWNDDEIDKLLESVDRGNPLGKRDYAILLLAIKLGLRCSDIKSLKFSDINWEEKRIDIIQQKTQKPLSLPLPNDVGWAIIDYAKNARPESDSPEIFLRHVSPIGPFSNYSTLGSIISRYRTIAGIAVGDKPRKGMHSLRHTFATRLLREQVPLETIAEMLGHVGMRSVDIYLNVETESLRKIALSPEEVFVNV